MGKLMMEIESVDTLAKLLFIKDFVMGGFSDDPKTWETLSIKDRQRYKDEAKESLEYEDPAPVLLEDEMDAIIEHLDM